MELIRYMFLISILECSTSIGFLMSKRYVDILNELTDLINQNNGNVTEAIASNTGNTLLCFVLNFLIELL